MQLLQPAQQQLEGNQRAAPLSIGISTHDMICALCFNLFCVSNDTLVYINDIIPVESLSST